VNQRKTIFPGRFSFYQFYQFQRVGIIITLSEIDLGVILDLEVESFMSVLDKKEIPMVTQGVILERKIDEMKVQDVWADLFDDLRTTLNAYDITDKFLTEHTKIDSHGQEEKISQWLNNINEDNQTFQQCLNCGRYVFLDVVRLDEKIKFICPNCDERFVISYE
jgi:deoxyadenosine/deoxycytidine kinase